MYDDSGSDVFVYITKNDGRQHADRSPNHHITVLYVYAFRSKLGTEFLSIHKVAMGASVTWHGVPQYAQGRDAGHQPPSDRYQYLTLGSS